MLLKRLILPLLIALPISALVTVVLFFAAGFLGGACHCMTPVSILFPYGTFITMRTRFENAGFLLDLMQFPVYASVVAILNGWRQRIIGSVVLLTLHVIAAIGALTMYSWY